MFWDTLADLPWSDPCVWSRRAALFPLFCSIERIRGRNFWLVFVLFLHFSGPADWLKRHLDVPSRVFTREERSRCWFLSISVTYQAFPFVWSQRQTHSWLFATVLGKNSERKTFEHVSSARVADTFTHTVTAHTFAHYSSLHLSRFVRRQKNDNYQHRMRSRRCGAMRVFQVTHLSKVLRHAKPHVTRIPHANDPHTYNIDEKKNILKNINKKRNYYSTINIIAIIYFRLV